MEWLEGRSLLAVLQPTLADAIYPTPLFERTTGNVLDLTGTNFLDGATVYWTGYPLDTPQPLTTHFISSTELTADVPDGFVAEEASNSVVVQNPGAALGSGEGTSNSETVNVLESLPVLLIPGLSTRPNPRQGELVTLQGTVNDIDIAVIINWGDGLPQSFPVLPDGSFTATHTYQTAGQTDTLTAIAQEEDGTVSNQIIRVFNIQQPAAPSLDVTATVDPSTIDENGTTLLTGSFNDTGSGVAHTVFINWGDSSVDSINLPIGATTFQLPHVYQDNLSNNAPYPITVTVTGGVESGIADTSVVVNNVAPTATFYVSALSITYGDSLVASLSNPSDQSTADTAAGFHYAFGLAPLGDATYDNSSSSPSATLAPRSAGTSLVYARVIDKDGGYREYSIPVTVNKADLSVTATNNTKTYGQTAHDTGAVSGWKFSDNITATFASAGDNAHAPVGSGSYPITATLSDPNGKLANYNVHETDATLTVNKANATITVTGYDVAFDNMPHTATGTAIGVFGESLASGLNLASTTHTTAGIYIDTWTFHDSAGNYNDAAGTITDIIGIPVKVTGGGKLSDSVTFGFEAQPVQDGTISQGFKGHFQFEDKAGWTNNSDLKFNSTAILSDLDAPYASGTNSGGIGVITGAGSVNGVTGYYFRASVADNSNKGAGNDVLQMAIYTDAAMTNCLYNSTAAAGTSAADTLAGGNIKIHFDKDDTTSSSSVTTSDTISTLGGGGQFLTGTACFDISNVRFGPTGGPLSGDIHFTMPDATVYDGYVTGVNVGSMIDLTGPLTVSPTPGSFKLEWDPVHLTIHLWTYDSTGKQLSDTKPQALTTGGVSFVRGDSAPVVSSVVLNSYTPKSGDTLTATASASDPDSDGIVYTYQWNYTPVGGTPTVVRTMTTSNNKDAYKVSASSGTVSVTVTATDPYGKASAASPSMAASIRSALMAAGYTTDVTSSLGSVASGARTVAFIDDDGDPLKPDELARVQDAIGVLNTELSSLGVSLAMASPSQTADITIQLDTTTPFGGQADGVLGSMSGLGLITIVQGWDWYLGADPSAIGTDQFDFETIVMHELGHSLGLGHSSDAASVMYASLAAGEASRALTASDLSQISAATASGQIANDPDGGALHAALPGRVSDETTNSYRLQVKAAADSSHTVSGTSTGAAVALLARDRVSNSAASLLPQSVAPKGVRSWNATDTLLGSSHSPSADNTQSTLKATNENAHDIALDVSRDVTVEAHDTLRQAPASVAGASALTRDHAEKELACALDAAANHSTPAAEIVDSLLAESGAMDIGTEAGLAGMDCRAVDALLLAVAAIACAPAFFSSPDSEEQPREKRDGSPDMP